MEKTLLKQAGNINKNPFYSHFHYMQLFKGVNTQSLHIRLIIRGEKMRFSTESPESTGRCSGAGQGQLPLLILD